MKIDPTRTAEIQIYAEGFIAKYGDAVIARMAADGAVDTSDAEIERTLGSCVCGGWLPTLAKEMRRRGLLQVPAP